MLGVVVVQRFLDGFSFCSFLSFFFNFCDRLVFKDVEGKSGSGHQSLVDNKIMFRVGMNKVDVFWSVFNYVSLVIVVVLNFSFRLHKFANVDRSCVGVLFQKIIQFWKHVI